MSDRESVRERIKRIQVNLRDGALSPDMARESLVMLTALLGNVNDACTDADIAYCAVLDVCYGREETANRARIKAETTPEYRRKRETKDAQVLVVEMIRSCRAYLRSLDQEMQLTR